MRKALEPDSQKPSIRSSSGAAEPMKEPVKVAKVVSSAVKMRGEVAMTVAPYRARKKQVSFSSTNAV